MVSTASEIPASPSASNLQETKEQLGEDLSPAEAPFWEKNRHITVTMGITYKRFEHFVTRTTATKVILLAKSGRRIECWREN